jgi:HSP20 family protein
MTLIKRVNNNFPGLFEGFLGRDFNEFLANDFASTLPAVNVVESKEDFRIEVAAPGLKKEKFRLNVDHNRLTISSEVSGNQEQKEEKYTRREFSYGSFQRTFTLPQTVDTEKISATYTDGVLQIALPKREEAKVKPARAIEIA